MLDPRWRARLGRMADVAMVAAFLALTVFAYGALFVGAGKFVTVSAPSEFADFYQPGQNPWSGVVVEPAPPREQFASTAPARQGYR